MIRHLSILFISALFTGISLAQPCNLSGTYTIGHGANYNSVSAALTSLRTSGMAGPVVLELTTGYLDTAEVFPLRFDSIPCISATNTLTLRPQVGATNRQISSAFNGNTIALGNARYITIDGRPGGIGNARELTISNYAAGGNVFNFYADASFNTLTYLTIKGSTSSPNSGVIAFLITGLNITNGNNYNTVSYCNIGDANSEPFNCIYSAGSFGKKNSKNRILNNNIYNFYSTGSNNTVNGIYLGANNTEWEIDGNSFYQTVARGNNSAILNAININDPTSDSILILNNFIGGTAPNCGGAPLYYVGTFSALKIFAGTAAFTTLGNNTISNITWKNYFSHEYFNGIQLIKGKIDCGGATGNLIGSLVQRASIVSTSTSLNTSTFNAITVKASLTQTSADSFLIHNNKIGGILAQRAPDNFSSETDFIGIHLTDLKYVYVEVANNLLGSLSVSKSIESANSAGSIKGLVAYVTDNGIGNNGYPLEYKISGNIFTNWYGNSKVIDVSGGIPQLLNNTIKNIVSEESAFYNSTPYLVGITVNFALPGTLVSGNTIQALSLKGMYGASATGIIADYSNGITISKNFIHSFQSEPSGVIIWGIRIPSNTYLLLHGNYNIQNNMIRLGVDTAGNIINRLYQVYAIDVPLDSTIITNNTVYLQGDSAYDGGSAALYLNQRRNGSNKIINNILQNNRRVTINSFNTVSAIKFNETITDNSGLQLNNNIYFSNFAGTATGIINNLAYTGILPWRAATGQDSNSIFFDPHFINPNGNVNTVNLHLANPTPAEGQGIYESTLMEDIDGEIRSGLTPEDIGADGADFVLIDGDAPIVKYAPFAAQPLGVAVTYHLKITDNGAGIDDTPPNKPRMWFRKIFPVAGGWTSVEGNLVQGTLKGGTWDFTPDYAAAGITLSSGDSLAFYFVAQDIGTAPHISFSNFMDAVHTDVNTQVSPATNPFKVLIYGVFPDTIYVGAGQTYTSLTNTGGFFEAAKSINFNAASSNVRVIITSDLLENGTHNFTMFGGPGPKITISTNTPVEKIIQNSFSLGTEMIRMNDIYNVTIDGSVNGSGRFLRFVNTHYNPDYCQPLLNTSGKIFNVTIRNCIFNSNINANYYYMVQIGGSEIRKFVMQGNLFSNADNGYNSLPKLMAVISVYNKDTSIIRNNEFTNFNNAGMVVYSGSNATLQGTVLVDSNHFYQNSITPASGDKNAILVSNSRSPVILSNNFIGGSAKFCGGAAWEQNDYGVNFKGINYTGSYDSAGSIQNNRISNIRLNGYNSYLTGIYLKDGIFNVGTQVGNTIGSVTNDSSLMTSYQLKGIEGIAGEYTNYRPLIRIENNIVAGSISGNFSGIYFQGKKMVVNGNSIFNHLVFNSFSPDYKGIRVWLDSGQVSTNTIYNLYNTTTSFGTAIGMDLLGTGATEIMCSRNRIHGLQCNGGPELIGMQIQSGLFQLKNNQVSLSNGGNTNNISLKGLVFTSGNGTLKAYYNSIYIAGTNGGASNSYAVYVNGTSQFAAFKNNLLYNKRIGTGAKHIALGMLSTATSPVVWPAGIASTNLYIGSDTMRLNEWKTNGVVNWNQWKNLSQGDAGSFTNSVQKVKSDSLFIDAAIGNLNINNLSGTCWQVNEKGKPIAGITDDFDAASGVRSVDLVNGKTDIGSDEFSTATIPLPVQAPLCPGGNTSLTSNITGTSYQWQLNTGSGFINISNNANYAGTNTATLQLNNIPSTWYGYQYRCVVNGVNSTVSELQFVNRWIGGSSTAWENPANWGCGTVPDMNTDVIINSGTAIVNVNTTCRTISVSAGANFSVAPGVVLTVLH